MVSLEHAQANHFPPLELFLYRLFFTILFVVEGYKFIRFVLE